MERLPFSPQSAAGPPADIPPGRRERAKYAHAGEAQELSVSDLSNLIKRTLDDMNSPLTVVGEISNLNARNHWYFSLKDEAAVVNCVAWASQARSFKLPRPPRVGDKVIVRGSVSHYAPQGRTQFYVTAMKPAGEGDLHQQFLELKNELQAAGYFDDARKRPLPPHPRRIAIVTSSGSAAEHDVIKNAHDRLPAARLLLVNTPVQGDHAAAVIARAIRYLDANAESLGIDAIVVTRGGGSIEDLWAFNERVVADAVFERAPDSVPIIAAIGHESDSTIVEFVADVRASTPTKAISELLPHQDELRQQVDHLEGRLRLLTKRAVEHKRQRLTLIERSDVLRDPHAWIGRLRDGVDERARRLAAATDRSTATARIRLEQLAGRWAALARGGLDGRQQRLAVLADRLQRATRQRVDRHRERVASIEQRLDAVDPLKVLDRGFSYTTLPDGRVLRSTAEAAPGTRLRTHVADGDVHSVVEGPAARPARKPRSKSTPATPPPAGDEPQLFGD